MASDPTIDRPIHQERHADERVGANDLSGDEADIRYSLTALGEALVTERAGRRFRGFGPCSVAALAGAG